MHNKEKTDRIDYLIKSLAINLQNINSKDLKSFDITNPQARLLGVIFSNIENNVETSRKGLQTAMTISGPSITSLLHGLEKSGYIVKTTGKYDGRSMELHVTHKGQSLIYQMDSVFDKTQDKLTKEMNATEKSTFKKLLLKAYENIQKK